MTLFFCQKALTKQNICLRWPLNIPLREDANLEATTIKQSLLSLISEMAKEPEHYVKNPGKDFTRNRKLTFETMLKMMLCMGGNTLNEELYDWFEFSADTPSVSAFV